MSRSRLSNREMRKIAETRILQLLSLSTKEMSAGNIERGRRYFRLARAISLRTNTPMPKSILFCRKCNNLLLPSKNCIVRVRRGRIVIHCLECGEIRRKPFTRAKGVSHVKENE